MDNMFRGKKCLVTGGTGMIGSALVQQLIDLDADVYIASLDDPSRAHSQATFCKTDLTNFDNCLQVCQGMDYVFHLAGTKGSPAMCAQQPASFFVPMLQFNTNMMEAARRANVEWYLYTSSIGVYAPSEKFYECDVWSTMPSKNDWFAGWAKRMGELQAKAYEIEYGWKKVSIVRPANVFGMRDNYDPRTAMVIPSLIRRIFDGENPLKVWGDGSTIRDFIYAEDCAQGMLFAVENRITTPLNLGSGTGISIKELVEIILKYVPNPPEVVWDISKPSGDKVRIMDMQRAKGYGFAPKIGLEEGIRRTIEWFQKNREEIDKRYNVFNRDKI